jgi:hypothetical protein
MHTGGESTLQARTLPVDAVEQLKLKAERQAGPKYAGFTVGRADE